MENTLVRNLLVLLLGLWLPLGALGDSTDFPTGFIKKVVVFPMDNAKANTRAAEEAWWRVRETLTDTRRFLVASKRFLVQKDVLQPRSKLTPPDAILLGQLLDADALLVMNLKNRELEMTVYSRFDGGVLWANQIQLHPSVPLDQQLEDAAKNLAKDFIAAVPFQGVQILDPLINKPVFEEGDIKLAKIDVGTNSRTAEGDPVQWISIEKTTSSPLFQSGSKIDLIAEGEVVKNESGVLLVEIKRVKDEKLLKTNSLVRLPHEVEFLKSNFALQGSRALSPELRYTPLPPAKPEYEESKPLVTAIVSIANLAAFILMVF